MSTAEELWLAQNTIECKPYAARISRAACVAHQGRKDRFFCPCADAVTDAKPLPKRPDRRRSAGLAHWLDTGVKLENPATEAKPKRGRKGTKNGASPYTAHFRGTAAPAPEPPAPEERLEKSIGGQLPQPKRRRRARLRRRSPAQADPGPALERELQKLAARGHRAAAALVDILKGG